MDQPARAVDLNVQPPQVDMQGTRRNPCINAESRIEGEVHLQQ